MNRKCKKVPAVVIHNGGFMKTNKAVIVLSGIAIVTALSVAIAQQVTPPAASPKVLTSVDLGPDIEAMKGRVLKLQITTYEPGKASTLHSHKGRVEVIYMLQGAIIETNNGVAKEYRQGDAFFANKDTNHVIENKGNVPALLIVSMIADK
jgi:quercetin dioxygenase-like cupin family protein